MINDGPADAAPNPPAAALPLVAVTFALPDESRAFTRRLTAVRTVLGTPPPGHLPILLGVCAGGSCQVLVIHTGVGDTAGGRRRLEFALTGAGGATQTPPARVISSGYAGALATGLHVGDLILADNGTDPEMAARAQDLSPQYRLHGGRLATQRIAAETPSAKAALAAATGAAAVDMESGWIAEICAQAGVPMIALRAISDAAGQAFPVPANILFDAARQRPRYAALPLWLLLHPHRIGPFVRFVRGLAPAQVNLAGALERLLSSSAVNER